MDAKPVYKRVLLKLSGEALMGDDAYGINRLTLERIVAEVTEVVRMGVEVGVVIGGGNIFRGVAPGAAGMDRATADYMGMLGTVMNALALQDAMRQVGLVSRIRHHPRGSRTERLPGELLVLGQLGGEQAGQLLLPGGKHVDAETLGLGDQRERARLVGEADQQQQRVQRERADGVRGHPHRAELRAGRHDGDPGREMTHHGAEALGGDGVHQSTLRVPYMPSSSWLASTQYIV